MRQTIEYTATPATDRGGACAGPPEIPSRYYPVPEPCLAQDAELLPDFVGASIPASWLGDPGQGATRPLRTNPGYEQAITACIAELAARRARPHSKYALSPSDLDPRLGAWLVALVILLLVMRFVM